MVQRGLLRAMILEMMTVKTEIAGDIFGDAVGTLVERLKAAIAWQNKGTESDLTEQDRQRLRDLLAFVQ